MGKKPVVKKQWAVLAVAAGILAVSQWALAHHSLSAVYRGERDSVVTGVATAFLFGNPHAVIHFEVRDANGNVERWTAETSGPRRLGKAGWDEKTVKPGDRITIVGRVAKDGSKKMYMEKIVVNGKEYGRGRRR